MNALLPSRTGRMFLIAHSHVPIAEALKYTTFARNHVKHERGGERERERERARGAARLLEKPSSEGAAKVYCALQCRHA